MGAAIGANRGKRLEALQELSRADTPPEKKEVAPKDLTTWVATEEARRKAIDRDLSKGFGGKKDNTNPMIERPRMDFVKFEVTGAMIEGYDVIVFSKPFDWVYPGGGREERRTSSQDGKLMEAATEDYEQEQAIYKHTSATGRFYSVKYRWVGTWRKENNVLILRNDIDPSKSTVTVWCRNREDTWENPFTHTKFSTIDTECRDVVPIWLRPAVLSHRFERTDDSAKNFECAICYFPLCAGPVACMRNYSKRVCEHYVHHLCGHHHLKIAKLKQDPAVQKGCAECPLCGSSYNDLKVLPDPMVDPRGWFQCCDVDCSDSLDPTEIIEGLGARYPIPRKKLEQVLKDHWYEWDPNGDGVLSLREIVQKEPRGLKDFLCEYMTTLRQKQKEKGLTGMGGAQLDWNIPDIDTHPKQWFDYWDVDGSGTLEPNEMVRALIRSFCITSDGEPNYQRAFVMRGLAMALWEECGYHPWDSIDFETFMQPGGVGDTMMHNMVHGGTVVDGIGNKFC